MCFDNVTVLPRSGSWSGTDSRIRTVTRMVTKIELFGPWAMHYPPRNFVKIRSQIFQLSDGQTDRQTDRTKNITSFGGGNNDPEGKFFKCLPAVKRLVSRSYCLFLLCRVVVQIYCVFVSKVQILLPQMYQAFSGYDHFASVTGMLSNLELTSFDTVISKSKYSITMQCEATDNLLVRHYI